MIRQIYTLILLFSIHLHCGKIIDEDQLIADITKKKAKWKTKKFSRFNNISTDSVKKLMGVLGNKFKKRSLQLDISNLLKKNFPKNFDLRTEYPECTSIGEVYDQSYCGSCWAFSVVNSLSDRICIASRGKKQPVLSAENLLSCCLYCGNGCNGGNPFLALDYISRYGIPTGGRYNTSDTCQPYIFPPCDHHVSGKYGNCIDEEVSTPQCDQKCINNSIDYNNDKWYIKQSYQVDNNIMSIMSEIFHFGPVVASLDIYEDFLFYGSGVYQQVSGDYLGKHAMKIIGWGVEDNIEYWLAVNSWNTDWGDDGIFKIVKGIDNCGIESSVIAGIPLIKNDIIHIY